MAGQLLNSLKGSGAKPAASHEARLGIMVITILVFAFGFLVYHKMDMHQRQLTQASIAPNGNGPTEVTAAETTAGLLSSSSTTAGADPMVNTVNIEDLSNGSPFSDPATATMEVKPAFESSDEPFATLNEPASAEPTTVFDEPVQLEQPVVANERVAAESIAADEPMLAMAEPSASQENFFPDLAESTQPELTQPELTQPEPETPTLDLAASATSGVVQPVAEPDNSFLSLDAASEAPIETADAPLLAVDEPVEATSGVAENAFDLSVPEPVFAPADSVGTSAEEPVLLALAEPQQADGFGDGFLLDENASSEPSKPAMEEPASDEPVGFPAFPETQAESRPVASQKRNASESRGFNAVKNPGGRKDGHTIRTAAGSGSDGKFSLAAFNYQNGAAPAAPDDGSTFNSVVVQNGDNYTKISKRVYGSVKYFSALAVFNQHRIPEPKNMRPGMVILVPEKEVLEERYPELFIDSQPKVAEIAEFFLLDDGSPAYRVGERETISQIAERYLGRSSRWIEIYRLNQSVLKDPNKLKAGLILALPADATEVNVLP